MKNHDIQPQLEISKPQRSPPKYDSNQYKFSKAQNGFSYKRVSLQPSQKNNNSMVASNIFPDETFAERQMSQLSDDKILKVGKNNSTLKGFENITKSGPSSALPTSHIDKTHGNFNFDKDLQPESKKLE